MQSLRLPLGKYTFDVQGLTRLFLAGLFVVGLAHSVWGAMQTVPRGRARGSEAVRAALAMPTFDGRVQALIGVLTGADLGAALEAMDTLALMGATVVPRLVAEMPRTRNNWLIGGALVKMGAEAVAPLIELLETADAPTAVDCIYLLGEIQDRRAVPTLIRYLDDGRQKVRMYAITALLQIGGSRAVEAVLSRLTRETKGLESFIVMGLLRYGRKSVEPIIQNLKSTDPRVREEAAFLLGQLRDARAVVPLVAALHDPTGRVRKNAAYALGQMHEAVGGDRYVIEALAGSLGDPDAEVVETARASVVRYGSAAVDALLDLCESGGVEQVVAALNALREIGSSDAEQLMLDLARHPRREVRVAAVAGLITSGTGESVEVLLDALRDEDLRWFATLALEKLGAENPRLFFTTSPSDPTMSLRTQILVTLGPAVVPTLTEFLQHGSVGRRAAALWILGEIGDPSAVHEVAWLLGDPALGWLAGKALCGMGRAGRDALIAYLKSPPSEDGALQAADALAALDDERAWQALEGAVSQPIPRAVRVHSAVLVSTRGSPERVDRLRDYLDGDGRHLWPEVKAGLRQAQQVR